VTTAKRTTAKKAASKQTLPDKVRALSTFSCVVDDDAYVIHEGEVVPTKHAVVRGHEDLFEPAPPNAHVHHP